MMEILSANLTRRLFLIISLAALLVTLISSLGRIEKLERNGLLKTRDLDYNLTVNPKVLIDWNTFMSKGNALSCAMRATEQDAAQYLRPGVPVNSEFVNYGDLTAWGWDVRAQNDRSYVELTLELAYEELNMNTANNVLYIISHFNAVNVDGEEYPSTGAGYDSIYNVQDGMITAHSSHSPENRSPDAKRYPKLKKWSDVTFLQWQHVAQGNVQNLNHIFQEGITNPETKAALARALGKPEDFDDWGQYRRPPAWRSFYPGSDEYNALLYTPNLRGVSWLLIQHKQQLGRRKISKITLFTAGGYPCLYLKIDPVPDT
ncbi:hypothetical protein Plec18170_003529 [Paecilomyces lecythidis]